MSLHNHPGITFQRSTKSIYRRHVLKITIGVIVLLFLVIQWKLSNIFQLPNKSAESIFRDEDLYNNGFLLKASVVYDNVKSFVETCQSYSLPVILVDPMILSRVSSYASNATLHPRNGCRFLCKVQKITTFAILSNLWTPKEEFYDSLTRLDFDVDLCATDASWIPDQYNTNPSHMSAHYIFHRQGHWVHLVILYERQVEGSSAESFWWLAKMDADCKILTRPSSFNVKLPEEELSLGLYDAAFSKFPLAKVSMDGVNFRAPQFIELYLTQITDSQFIECNQTRANVFHAKYSKDVGEKANFFRKAATETLFRAKGALDRQQIRFWLSSGTCLGWYRQCDLIPYSKDVDIGIWINDYKESLIPTLQASGIYLKHQFGKVSDSFELSFHSNEVKLDIFFFYEEKNYMWNGGTQARTGKKFKYVFPEFKLCRAELLGLFIRVPCSTEDYIKANYGDEWFVPVEQWDWKKSPPNVKENGQWPRDEWPQVIKTF